MSSFPRCSGGRIVNAQILESAPAFFAHGVKQCANNTALSASPFLGPIAGDGQGGASRG